MKTDHGSIIRECKDGCKWYGILEFNVPLDTVLVISEKENISCKYR